MDLNDIVKPQDKALNEIATLFYNEHSVQEQPYVSERIFGLKDAGKILPNLGKLRKLMLSLKQTIKLIKHNSTGKRRKLTDTDFFELERLLQTLNVSNYGFIKIKPDRIFREKGVPYKYALVVTIPMDKSEFNKAPHIDTQMEVMRVYGDVGIAVNKITQFFRSRGYNATPNHPMGGSIDYCVAGMDAGLGYIGRHGMLITPEDGACHRSAVVYTDIENLAEFIPPKNDHSWIADFCAKCGKCIRSCPTDAILKNAIKNKNGHVTSINYERCAVGFKEYGCGVCIKECPFTKIGYEKIYYNYRNKTTKRQHRV